MIKQRAVERGFTLIELMVAVAAVAILASIAYPSYAAYVKRSRVPAGLDALSSFAVRMEQRFQDVGSYVESGACAVAVPEARNYTVTCVPRETKLGYTGFTATAVGTGTLEGYSYSIDDTGARKTETHPIAKPKQDCWSVKGSACDAS